MSLKAACVKSLEALLIIIIGHNNLFYKGTPPSSSSSFADLYSQESQAAQRQILMEFLKEARRNKREV